MTIGMKIRDSGMPEESYWESLFDIPLILSKLEINKFCHIAELGCGYGSFSIPVARAISGTLYTFDIDKDMLARTTERAAGLNIRVSLRDVMEMGFGINVDAVLLFNILHCDDPRRLLRHAKHAINNTGEILVIHWRTDITTPRGPTKEIRPTPEQIAAWANEVGLEASKSIDLPPWHYGLTLVES
jgi:SAM-dependent methyltransferase